MKRRNAFSCVRELEIIDMWKNKEEGKVIKKKLRKTKKRVTEKWWKCWKGILEEVKRYLERM